jgi:acetoin utilization deacetylase AcuC-like enzyme
VPRERLVGLAFDDRFPNPFAEPIAHPSSPALVGRTKHLMDLFGIAERMRLIEPVLASDEQLTVSHTPEHLARVAGIAQIDGGDTGSGALIGRGGDRVARLAAGGTIAAVDAVMTGAVDAA